MIGALRGAVARFLAADGFLLSAGLAFFFLVCMIPLVLLGVSIVGFVLSTERAAQEVVGQLTKNFPVYKREITRVLLTIVETRKVSGVLGTLILILFSTQLFSASRRVMHRLLGVKGSGGFVRNLMLDAAMVLLLSVLLFLATVATWIFDWIQAFVMIPAHISTRWIAAAAVTLSLTVSAVMIYLGYRYLPRRGVSRGSALAGAVLASLLWEIAKRLFRLYILKLGLYGQIYGPLGILVAFVMFVYYSAIVFVFGASYVAALDSRRR